jgi:hypothetical protein
MKTSKIFMLLAFFVMLFVSCTNKGKKTNQSVFWGETNFYSDFPFQKYEPVKMEKTLEFDFNDDAQRLGFGNVEFEVIEKQVDEKNGKENIIPAKGITLYKNDALCPNNILTITPNDKEAKLTIVFTKDAEEGNHTLFLRVKNNGGLDRIDDTELVSGITVRKNDIHNPLALLLFWITVAIVVILAVCFLLARIILHPPTKFSKVTIDYNDGSGDRTVKMGSAYKLLCTNKKTRFSVFSKFFIGVVKIEVNDFWTSPVTIQSGSRRNNIRVLNRGGFEINPDEIVRREPFTITNDSGKKVTITTT